VDDSFFSFNCLCSSSNIVAKNLKMEGDSPGGGLDCLSTNSLVEVVVVVLIVGKCDTEIGG
jgi:hypothetical protein